LHSILFFILGTFNIETVLILSYLAVVLDPASVGGHSLIVCLHNQGSLHSNTASILKQYNFDQTNIQLTIIFGGFSFFFFFFFERRGL
jgi:hypothetical protein